MTADTSGDLVEDYLDTLLVSLSGSPRQVRHSLAEVEAHLRDAVAEGIASGMTQTHAQAQAVERMGPVQAITGRTTMLLRPSLALARRAVLAATLIGGAGLLTVGGAGLLAWLLDAVKGDKFMTAPWPPGTYSHADCARWLAGDPGTHSCVTAMLADHVGDFLLQATACGVAGLLALGAFLLLRPRWRDRATAAVLPPGTAEALGALLAGLAAVAFAGQVLNIETVQHGVGAGQPLSLAAAASVTAAIFAAALRRSLARARTPGT
jgi:hypothetical protein